MLQRSEVLEDVRTGLARPQKTLSPKWFYDERGSRLFERITELPEYYLTRTERALLEEWAPDLVGRLRPGTLIELGAGAATKTRIILDAMADATGGGVYVPVDVSARFLGAVAKTLRHEYPSFRILPLATDMTRSLELPGELPRPALFALLGSTIGNFETGTAIRLLGRFRSRMESGDRLLLGADLKKDAARIEAAYNDSRGLTAEFNRNVLHVLNRILGADFDPDGFEHRAFYDAEAGRVEMHLVASREHTVTVPGAGEIRFRAGESIRTELSHKYDRAGLDAMLRAAGLRPGAYRSDADRLFALVLASPA